MKGELVLNYLPVFIFLLAVGGVGGGMVVMSVFMGKKNPTAEKNSTYECGMVPFKDARGRFDVRFYLIGMLFILFDVEIVFLYPWAILFDRFNPVIFGFVEMILFIAVLLFGYVYVWRKGALDWS
ncbi:MAG TPA: NADH-quinone oxidoreductase subunit A [Proteobacteria bacterium]|nr:NAD(P)H-quinone oxidoreductase subunit 3 [bacterium BMS3Abin14]HDL54031.1 NADH-quinone oxidoreductase subunit A [Pseudomonadota bacterium]